MYVLEEQQHWGVGRNGLDVSGSMLRTFFAGAPAGEIRAGWRRSFGRESISARSAASSRDLEDPASNASSLSSLVLGSSSRASPAARSRCPMIG